MAARGRKTKYTPEVVARLVQAIELGATHKLAYQYAGISHETFYQWINTKAEFSDAVKAAEGKAAIGWLAKIERAANDGNWTAAAWKLERCYPQDYGRRVSISGDVLLRTIGERAATEVGLEPDAVVAEAERILAEVAT